MKDCDCEETSEDDSGDEEQTKVNNVIINIAKNKLKDKGIIPNARVWTAFMAHIPHADADVIRQDLERLETKYIMGLEVSSYEHIHFLVLMTNKEYAGMAKRVFIDKYKLKGRWWRTPDGITHPRQYGKEKEIRDLEKYAKYTIKDQNFLSNMSENEIEDIIKDKIENVKNTKGENANTNELKNELIEYCEEHMTHQIGNDNLINYKTKYHRLLKIKIIDFMRIKKLGIRKSTIDMYFYHIIAYSNNNLKMASADIVDILYPFD
jgi:hypothetical protein